MQTSRRRPVLLGAVLAAMLALGAVQRFLGLGAELGL
jgi:hypothetical protein